MKLDRIEIIDYLVDNHEDDEWLAPDDNEDMFNKQVDDLAQELDGAIGDRLVEWVEARKAGRPLGPLVNNLCYGDEDCPRCGGDPDGVCHHVERAQQEADHIREVEQDRAMCEGVKP